MKRILLVAALVATAAASSASAAVHLGVYTGHSKYDPKLYVTVDLQVVSPTRVNFRVNASAPCNQPGYGLGRSVGTFLDPTRPRLQRRNGSFVILHHDSFKTIGVNIFTTAQTYTITAHAAGTGLAGTVRVSETTSTGIVCDTGTLRWSAVRVSAPFPH